MAYTCPLLVLNFSICPTDLGKLLTVEIWGLLPEILTQEAQGGALPWNPHFAINPSASVETDFLDAIGGDAHPSILSLVAV